MMQSVEHNLIFSKKRATSFGYNDQTWPDLITRTQKGVLKPNYRSKKGGKI
jgi:hypothetical protein